MARVWRSTIALALGAVGVVLAIKIYYADAPQNSISAADVDLFAMAYNYLFLWGRLFVSSHWLPAEPWNQWGGELVVGVIGLCGLLWSLARRTSPWDIALLWIALTLLPPLLLNPSYVRDIPAGPSRYLYLASAGVALLEAALITGICAHFLQWRLVWGKLVYAVVILGATVASAAALGRAEAIAFYNEGRNYLAEGQIELGIAQLQRSLAVQGAAIDREDAYVRLCPMVLNQGGDVHSCLQAGRQAFPRNPTLHIYQQVVSALDGDINARRRLDSFRGKSVGRVVAEAYYHAGRGAFRTENYARAVAALSRSLAFDGRRDDARLSLRAARAALSKQSER
jgi:tetratricopeptide (TPR) repeat protein